MKTYEKIYHLLSTTSDYTSGEELGRLCGVSRTTIWKGIQQLDKKGIQIDASPKLGYKILKGDLLLPEWIAEQLSIPVLLTEKSASTQQDARRGIETQDSSPCLYLANQQSAAHGRFGRAFFTADTGGIYMSMHLSPNISYSTVKPYTILVAAAIVKAILQLTDANPQIKWVNDIYLNHKKIAGVLTEALSSVETQTITDVIIGIGLNFAIENFPLELTQKAGSLFEKKAPITRNQLIIAIWKAFFETPEEELIALYKEKSLVLGKEICFYENEQSYLAIARSLTDTGELIVELPDGQQKQLSSGEISLVSW